MPCRPPAMTAVGGLSLGCACRIDLRVHVRARRMHGTARRMRRVAVHSTPPLAGGEGGSPLWGEGDEDFDESFFDPGAAWRKKAAAEKEAEASSFGAAAWAPPKKWSGDGGTVITKKVAREERDKALKDRADDLGLPTWDGTYAASVAGREGVKNGEIKDGREAAAAWFDVLKESAETDGDWKEAIDASEGDPMKLLSLLKQGKVKPGGYRGLTPSRRPSKPLRVEFSEVDWRNVFVWCQTASKQPSAGEKDMVTETLTSWYLLGKLGGFNASSLQCLDVDDVSYQEFDGEQACAAPPAYFHDMGETQWRGGLCRTRFDLGTGDPIALDILVNALVGLSRSDQVRLELVQVGGYLATWPVDDYDDYEDGMESELDPSALADLKGELAALGLDEEELGGTVPPDDLIEDEYKIRLEQIESGFYEQR